MEVAKMAIALENAKSNIDIRNVLNDNSVLIKDLDIDIKEKDINTSKTLRKLRYPEYCQALIVTIEKLLEQRQSETARTLLKDVLISRGENQGKFFEIMTYYCLFKKRVRFSPQTHIATENCYKECESGYDADGEILEWQCVFDVKEFGIGFPHMKDFEIKLKRQIDQLLLDKINRFVDDVKSKIKKLEQEIKNEEDFDLKKELEEELKNNKRLLDRMNSERKSKLWDYTTSVDGLSSISTSELSDHIKSVPSIAQKLVEQAWEERIGKWKDNSAWSNENPIIKHGRGFFQERIMDLGITCTLESRISEKLRGTPHANIYEIDIYEWASKNKFYFMGDASQFVRNQPYMIICALDKNDNAFLGNTDQYDNFFRPLCRRIFIELNRMEDRNIKISFDAKAEIGYSVSEAVKKITGIIFLEVSELTDKKRFRTPMWVYLNPNADHPLLNYQKHQFHLMLPEVIEDYEYDNY